MKTVKIGILFLLLVSVSTHAHTGGLPGEPEGSPNKKQTRILREYCDFLLGGFNNFSIRTWNGWYLLQVRVDDTLFRTIDSPDRSNLRLRIMLSRYMKVRWFYTGKPTSIVDGMEERFRTDKYEAYLVVKGDTRFRNDDIWKRLQQEAFGPEVANTLYGNLLETYFDFSKAKIYDVNLRKRLVTVGDTVIVEKDSNLAVGVIQLVNPPQIPKYIDFTTTDLDSN